MREFDLIDRIRKTIGAPGRGTVVGIGDDAAVYEPPGGLELFTCDAFVEGVHFRRDFASFREIGSKCMVANVSDIAAMGGVPTRATVSVCVPPNVGEAEIADLYDGMLDVCRRYAVEIVGGDVVGSPAGLVVSVALLGAVDAGRVVTRAGAVAGDAIVVTGDLGASEAGLLALTRGLTGDGAIADAKRKHLLPTPRLAEAQAIIDVATPGAMIDVSDGLSSDARHIADESGVGITLREEALPVAPAAREIADRLGIDATKLVLGSGEEFELVVAIPPSEVERTAEHVAAVTGTKVTRIGEVTEASRGCSLVRSDGSSEPLARSGYEHLGEGSEHGA
jgi:thiamine-monophosphate kinase